ncbi:Ammonium transporter Rh type B-A [Lamellibrachia satsuma]|nr:Ammonium transporter Rh type B-A [Lamellibrachia satsuma]
MVQLRNKLAVALVVLQVVFVVLFALVVRYDDDANATQETHSRDPGNGGADPTGNSLNRYYAMFQDVHVMIFVGFGFLMTFLKRYGFSSVSYNLLISSVVIQWAILIGGFVHSPGGSIKVGITTLLTADFAAAAVLISFGAVLGKTSALQLVVMTVVEVVFFQLNEYLGASVFGAVDVGGSMFVHVFGAYFGLSVATVLSRAGTEKAADKEGSVYHSDLFSVIGTLFLWVFWPSFNAALAPGDDQHRAVVNTYFSLAACVVTTVAMSVLLNKNNKLDMVHIQNATLAGGVAVGTAADMMIQPWGALVVGSLAGVLSVVGFNYVTVRSSLSKYLPLTSRV